MQNKYLHKLGKKELFEIIYEQKKEIKELKEKNEELNTQLNDKIIKIKEAGSIADASMKINKIFEEAQKIADEYIISVKHQYLINSQVYEKEKPIKYNYKENIKKDPNKNSKKENTSLIIVENKLKVKKENLFYLIKKYINSIFLVIIGTIREKLKFSKLKKCKILIKQKKENKNNIKKCKISIKDLENEIKLRNKISNRKEFIIKVSFSILIVIAIAIILASKVFYILQVNGGSMEPNLFDGDLLLTSRIFGYKTGDIIAFYYNDTVLIKRVVAFENDIVSIDDEGNVYVNNIKLQEDYVGKLSYGNCNITFPYQVPKDEVFVLGDNRENSIDSRDKAIGTISKNKIIGKIQIRLNEFKLF